MTNRHRGCAGRIAIGSLYLALLTPMPGIAQSTTPGTAPETAQLLASYEGQNVTSIQFAGQPLLDVSGLTPLLAQHAGEPFSKEKIDRTIASLGQSGKVKKVRLEVDPEGNGVRVLLILEPAVYFGIFEFTGADRFSYSRLLQVANYPPQAPYNAGDIQQDQASLLKFFESEGYFRAQVQSQLKLDMPNNLADEVFHTVLGPKSKFGEVDIAGSTPAEAAKLTQDLHGLWARFHGAAIRPGKTYRLKTITNATRYLRSRLEKQGRLAAKVQSTGTQYNSDSNRADIHFDVDPGRLVHVRIQGAHLWSWTRKSLLPVYQGVGVDAELVQEGREALASYFQSKGYFDAAVSANSRTEDSVQTITYGVVNGKKQKVTEVALSGNRELTRSELLPYVAVHKAHFFSRGKYSQRLLQSSVANLTGDYHANGFADAKVEPTVTRKNRNLQAVFHIDEGPRDIVRSLRIEGARTLDEAQFAPGGLKLVTGGPYAPKLVDQDRKNVTARYLDLGYLTASFRETATTASKEDPHGINVVYHIDEGPRVFTAKVMTLGREVTKQRLIDRDVRSIQPAQPLTESHLLSAGSQLYNHAGVFDWAEVDPESQITTQTTENVLVKVHEAKRNELTYGFGFELINRGGNIPSGTVALPNLPPIGLPSTFTTNQQTFYGPRGTLEYTRNNLGGKGESLSFTAFAGRLDQRGSVFYIDPNFLWSQWRSTVTLSVEHDSENPIFSSQVESAGYELQRQLDKKKTLNLFLRYSFSQTDLTRVEIPALVLPADRHVRLSTLSPSFIRDTRDNPIDAHRGVFETIEADFNSTETGSNVSFAKLNLQDAHYNKIPGNIIWANDLRIGLAEPFAKSRVPVSEAFFTGGGNTLRGFPLDSAGPQRQVPVCSTGANTNCTLIQIPTGGNELLIVNSELRIPLPIKKNLGMAVFYDGGSVFPYVGFHDFTSLYSNDVGVGLRYATPVGPIRVDLGRNLNPVPGISPTQYFVSIGQAF